MSAKIEGDDLQRKIVAMENIAKVFASRNMIESVERIRELQQVLSSVLDESGLKTKFGEFLQDAWNEFIGNNKHRENCIKLVDRLITNAIMADPVKFHNVTTESIPSMQERTNARLMLGRLVSILRRSPNMEEEERMVAMNMLYLAMVEGPFEEDVKACYVWAKLAVKEDVSYDDVSNITISIISDYFKNKIGNACLFEGWERRLRNAIAHFSYSYDKNTKRMMYTDKRAKWNTNYTLDQLASLYEKLDNVDELIMIELLILSLRDICFAKTPPWKESDYL